MSGSFEESQNRQKGIHFKVLSASEVPKKVLERRKKLRFPLSLPVDYETSDDRGKGNLTEISTGGLVFTSARALPLGSRIRLSIAWPCSLDGTVPLQMVVEGVILRSDQRGAAVKILAYDFRTKGTIEATFLDEAGIRVNRSMSRPGIFSGPNRQKSEIDASH